MKQKLYLLFFLIMNIGLYTECSENELKNLESYSINSVWNNLMNQYMKVPGSFAYRNENNQKSSISKIKTNIRNPNTFSFKSIDEIEKLETQSSLNTKQLILDGWLSISSKDFLDSSKYPPLPLGKGQYVTMSLTDKQERINPEYVESNKTEIPGNTFFFFRFTKDYLYYFPTKEDIPTIGAIKISSISNDNNENCFNIVDVSDSKYHLCAVDKETSFMWLCMINSTFNIGKPEDCRKKQQNLNLSLTANNRRIGLRKVTQPMIIIPMPSRYANEQWDYKSRGSDWEGICKEGLEQSPIDLPNDVQAISSAVRPLFQYENINNISLENNKEGKYKVGENIKIIYDDFALRIYSNNFGKLVTVNGNVYKANQIVFHTPSEHTINSQRFDLEMQVIHQGVSKGDYGKKAILSFLFKAKPGVYNKFLEKLDFFNLPNPIEKSRDITNPLFIPHVFYDSDDEDIYMTPPFSFYTYSGSLSEPPCSENTIVYVSSKVIEVSVTTLELFKEALRIPYMEDEKGNIILGNMANTENYRQTQALNGRTIFYYEHTKYNCPEFIEKKSNNNLANSQNGGHYEKVEKTIEEYIFINGHKPSGMPGSFVVSDNEAKGDNI